MNQLHDACDHESGYCVWESPSHIHFALPRNSPLEDRVCACGMVYDSPAGLWRIREDYDEQEQRRRAGRAVLGSRLDTTRVNEYEKGLGL
jgi:hypothetical protein